ncbi:putative amidase [Septoria linicola]|nr:putative amidase [Septoria linicola]
MAATKLDWQALAATKRAAESAKIPEEWRLGQEFLHGNETTPISVFDVPAKCGILSHAELKITELDAGSLANAVQSGSLKAAAVATAFSKRAAIAQQLTQCLTETFFDDAIARGQYLDTFLAEHGKPLGPLHGVPVSIKDSFRYKGSQSTLGFVSFLDGPADTENSPLVDLLLDLGAILYCKTNIPLTLMTADSHNNVFGRVLNPHKLNLGAGGSSGGEGALVAFKGSPLGIGTDIGGSVRIPALVNGTYGLKPTPNRVPYGNQAWCSARGSPGFPACAGPLANSFEDIALFMRVILEASPWDPAIADRTPGKLRIGYYVEDPAFPTHPPVRRALEASANALAKAGHEIIVLSETPSIKTSVNLAASYWSMDNSRTWLKNIEASGEPIIPSLLKTLHTLAMKPDGFTLEELFSVNVLAGEYKALWHNLWVQNQLDIILCPPAQTTAVLHDDFGVPHYTILWNLLQYPGLIIPVGTADKSIDTDDLARPEPEMGRIYRAEDVHGAPTSIQLVTRPMQDEELISYSRLIDGVLKAARGA